MSEFRLFKNLSKSQQFANYIVLEINKKNFYVRRTSKI